MDKDSDEGGIRWVHRKYRVYYSYICYICRGRHKVIGGNVRPVTGEKWMRGTERAVQGVLSYSSAHYSTEIGDVNRSNPIGIECYQRQGDAQWAPLRITPA